MATAISTLPERARYPRWLARTSYQVGRPWMLEGKKFLPATGIPIRNRVFISNELALAEPVPFTLAMRIVKSLSAGMSHGDQAAERTVEPTASDDILRPSVDPLGGIPSASWSAYGVSNSNFCMSQAAVGQRSAQRPQCTQRSSSLIITLPVWGSSADTYSGLVQVVRRGGQAARADRPSSPFGAIVRQCTGQMSTQASHSMHSGASNTVLNIAIQAALRLAGGLFPA